MNFEKNSLEENGTFMILDRNFKRVLVNLLGK